MIEIRISSLKKVALAIGAAAIALPQPVGAFAQSAADSNTFGASQIEGQTQVEKTVGKCVVAVAGGAIIGALLGGRQNAGRGALIGAGAGVGVCAYMMSVASAQDKARLKELQLRSLNSGQSTQDQWQTSDGKYATANVSTSNIVRVSTKKSGEVVNCRRANTHLSVNGQANDSSDIVCLRGDSWVTLDKMRSMGVDVGDVVV
jgi:hypothetical protein